MAASATELAFNASSKIGRYFSIVSAIPSALLVIFGYVLVRSGAWGGDPNWSSAARALSRLGVSDVALLAVLSLALGMALHPLQYALTQLFEGYWGANYISQQAMASRVLHHRRRYVSLWLGSQDSTSKLTEAGQLPNKGQRKVSDENVSLLVTLRECERLKMYYPDDKNDVMPTRLGNVLRRYERLAGAPYGLDAVTATPRFAMVAPKEHVEYLDEQRTQLDLAVRLCLVGLLASAIATAFLWRHGLWLLVGAVAYAFSYLFYRGATVVAHEYGTAMAVLIELNRFAVYERLHLPLPGNTELERFQNETLSNLFAYDQEASLRYRHPPSVLPGEDARAASGLKSPRSGLWSRSPRLRVGT